MDEVCHTVDSFLQHTPPHTHTETLNMQLHTDSVHETTKV